MPAPSAQVFDEKNNRWMSAQRLLPAAQAWGQSRAGLGRGGNIPRAGKSKGLQPGHDTKPASKARPRVSCFAGWSRPRPLGTVQQPKKLLLQEVQPCACTQHKLFSLVNQMRSTGCSSPSPLFILNTTEGLTSSLAGGWLWWGAGGPPEQQGESWAAITYECVN